MPLSDLPFSLTGAAGLGGLAAAALVAYLAALALSALRRPLIPLVVVELLLGIAFGPQGLGWIAPEGFVEVLAELGAAFLFFLAGYHIEPRSLRGADGRRAGLTWVIAALLAFALSLTMTSLGIVSATAPVAIALSTTAVGALIPILKDADLQATVVGRTTLAIGAFGELGPIILLSLLLSGRSPVTALFALLGFALAAIVIWGLNVRAPNWLTRLVLKGRRTNAQTPIRWVLLLLLALTFAAVDSGAEFVLGAFVGGQILRLLLPTGDRHIETVMEGIGYGWFIPLYFIVSGASLDVVAITERPLVPVVLMLVMLAVHSMAVIIMYWGRETRRERVSVALFTTTALPLVVASTAVAVKSGIMPSDTAALLVGAALLTMLIMPILGRIAARPESPDNLGELPEFERPY